MWTCRYIISDAVFKDNTLRMVEQQETRWEDPGPIPYSKTQEQPKILPNYYTEIHILIWHRGTITIEQMRFHKHLIVPLCYPVAWKVLHHSIASAETFNSHPQILHDPITKFQRKYKTKHFKKSCKIMYCDVQIFGGF